MILRFGGPIGLQYGFRKEGATAALGRAKGGGWRGIN
jgi:hypothetical protein